MVVGAALLLSSGVALAAINEIYCSGGECSGTESDDRMFGMDDYDLMRRLGGDDNMFGNFGHDKMYGGEGADFLMGDEDYDWPDTMLGNDTLYGGPGNDDLRGAFGNDRIHGGGGDDFIFAYDQLGVTTGADRVDCGRGVEEVHYDKGIDEIRRCEIKEGPSKTEEIAVTGTLAGRNFRELRALELRSISLLANSVNKANVRR
jgi:hypothetical protein